MQNKTIQILTLLRSDELKRFDKWLRSPWCNSNKKLVLLYSTLRKHHPDFASPTLTKERLFKKCYPNKIYDDKWMRNLLAALTGAAEQFLQHERLRREPYQAQKFLISEYQERDQAHWFDKKIRQLIAQLEALPGKDWETLFDLTCLYEKWHRQPGAVARQLPGASALQRADQWMDELYALGKARFLVEFAERNKIVGEAYKLEPAQQYLSALLPDLSTATPQLYLEYITSAEQNDWASFLTFKNAFFTTAIQLSKKDQTIFLLLLLNRAGRLRLLGQANIDREILDLYQFGLQHQLLLTNGHLTEATFTNIVVIANELKDPTFARQFITDYSDKLSSILQEDGRIWGMAYTDAHAHAHGKVATNFARSLAQRRRDYTSFYIRSKALLMSIYFDEFLTQSEQDTSFLLDYCHAFEKLLQRHKNYPKKNRLAIIKCVQYVRKLCLLRYKVVSQLPLLEALAVKIKAEPALHDRRWLLQKVAEMRRPLSR